LRNTEALQYCHAVRRPTLDDVAQRAGVSRTLVSMTLRGLPGAGEDTRHAIVDAAAALGYVPHAAARNLASQSSRAIGVTMPLYINATQSAVARQYLGVVSSQIQFWRNVGGTVGVAILGAVVSHELPERIKTQVAALNLPPQISASLPSGGSAQAIFDPVKIAATKASLPPQAQPLFDQVLEAIRSALALSLHDVFIYAAAVVSVAVVASLFLKEVPLKARERPSTDEVREGAPAFGD